MTGISPPFSLPRHKAGVDSFPHKGGSGIEFFLPPSWGKVVRRRRAGKGGRDA